MANTSLPFTSVFSGGPSSPAPARSPFARRRWVFVGLMLIALIAVATLTNYGPLRAYHSSRAQFEAAAAQVKALEQKKDQMQVELGKLNEADYLESLARQELTYARPGEQIYVVTGAGDGTTPAGSNANLLGAGAAAGGTESSAASETEKPGLLERMLSAIGRLF